MSFKLWLETESVNSRDEALRILGLQGGASLEDAKRARNQLAAKYHPDINKGPDASDKMKRINMAYDFIKNNTQSSPFDHKDYKNDFYRRRDNDYDSSYNTYSHKRETENPPWQTDDHLPNNHVGKDFSDINFCKKAIYEKSIKAGPVGKWYLNTFDGTYPRLGFHAMTNDQTLGYAGEVLEEWNHNSYHCLAVFAQKGDEIKMIRVKGKDISSKGIYVNWRDLNINTKDLLGGIWNSPIFRKHVGVIIFDYLLSRNHSS